MVNSGSTIQFGDVLRSNENKILSIINDNNMLHSVYFKKGADWSEEIEYRWLVFSANLEQEFLLVDIRDAIHSVVLGSKFPPEKYEEVKGYCRSLKCSCYALSYSHPKYTLCKVWLGWVKRSETHQILNNHAKRNTPAERCIKLYINLELLCMRNL
jgi:hypothetical protein